jgi:tripeptidyl-peptidase I
MTIACIKYLYSIPDATKATPGNSLGLFEQGDYFSEADLDLWLATYAPNIPLGTFPVNSSIDGASYSVPQGSAVEEGEAEIDIELA